MHPKISVILPVYNIEGYLPDCIASLKQQDYDNLEFVFVNDGSTDGSVRLLEAFAKQDDRVRLLHKVNGGLSDARNFGIARANGEYIACVDPDDVLEPDYFSYLYGLIEQTGCKMSLCMHRVEYDSGKCQDLGQPQKGMEVLNAKEALEKMLYHEQIDTSAWGKLAAKEVQEGILYPKGRLFEDIGTTYRLFIKAGKIAVGHESKYHYKFHANSIVNSRFSMKKMDLLAMTDQMAKDVLALWPDLYPAVLRRQIYARFSTLNQMLEDNDPECVLLRRQMMEYIFLNFPKIQGSPRLPKRDQAAWLLLKMGWPIYRLAWKVWQKAVK